MKKHEKTSRSFLISCLLSQAVWLASILLLLLLFCAIAYSTADPDSIIRPLSLCALYLSSLIGGISAVRFSGDGIVSGCLSGIITTVIVFCISVLPLHDSGIEMPYSLIFLLLIIPASAAGSILGHRKEKKPKKNTRKRARQ